MLTRVRVPRPALLVTLVTGAAGFLVAVAWDADAMPDLAIVPATALVAVAGATYGGRSAWTAGAACLAWLAAMYLISGEHDIGLAMLTVPGFLAGTVVRLRRETAAELERRGRELDWEREQLAALAVRNERSRIAAELHDIVGHSLSVMVVQAAAGQRLAQQDPGAGTETLAVIAESARQGRDDLHRLVELLGGQAPPTVAAPVSDLALTEELVDRAARAGLRVTCRFEGDRDAVSAAAAAAAFRVVRESLTNALRHAPGAAVHVVLRGEGGRLVVRVANDAPSRPSDRIEGSGHGLRGLRERVEELGGRLTAANDGRGGWAVEATLPTP